MRSDRDRLEDILEAIERIERHTFAGREVFDSDELVQTWVVHYLEIIGARASLQNSGSGIPMSRGGATRA